MEKGNGCKKGLWTVEEDRILTEHIRVHGKGRWNRTAKMTGLKRCGKSCRLRWINYLSPNIKRGDFSEDEDDLIIRLHNLLGNRWSLIAGRVPGRTDNQVKNHWNSHLSKKLGFNKAKTKVIASSRTTSENFNVSVKINSKPHSHGNGEAENEKKKDIKDHGSGGLVFEAEGEKTMSGGYLSSFWFSSDDFNVNAPSLTQLLDQRSPEFVWHGL